MNTKKIVLFDIDNTLFNTLRFKQTDLNIFSLYEDAVETLTQLKEHAELGVFSEGDLAFQKKKLHKTNIENYFLQEHTHIFPEKIHAIETLVRKYRTERYKVFLIDDKLSILPVIKKEFPSLFTIWIKRGEYAPKQLPLDGFSPDAEVETLFEAIPLIINH